MDCPYPQCKKCKRAYDKLKAQLAEVKAERDRYKKALEEIAEYEWAILASSMPTVGRNMQHIARTALEGRESRVWMK